MPTILVSKKIKQMAKEREKQCGKDFIEALDRKVYMYVEKIMDGIRFKRLSSKDLVI